MTFLQLSVEMTRLYSEGKYAEALAIVEQHEGRFPEQAARIIFWKLCLLSMSARTQDVIDTFQHGLDSGLWWGERPFADTDLDAVRDLPEFQRLMQISLDRYRQAQEQAKPERTILVPDTYEATLPLLIALHGGGGNKNSNLEQWAVARRRGWFVLSPQSTSLIFPNAHWWAENMPQRLHDIRIHYDDILQHYPIDRNRIVIAGMSQGSGMAIYTALCGEIPARGFISVAVGWNDTTGIAEAAGRAANVRGYFVIGDKDHTLQSATEIRMILRDHNIPFAEEVHPDLGHEFPSDFEKSFDQAIDFIFKEN